MGFQIKGGFECLYSNSNLHLVLDFESLMKVGSTRLWEIFHVTCGVD